MIFSRKRGRPGDDDIEVVVDEVEEPLPAPRPDFGPYDEAEVPDGLQIGLDLGALRVPAVPDVAFGVPSVGPQGEIPEVHLRHGESLLRLAVFAAPRSAGIWDDIRAENVEELTKSGTKVAEIDGEYGPELRARVRDGSGALVEIRRFGVDGPRWFVLGTYMGAAATNPDQDAPLRQALHNLVVVRGADARPVREPLTLRLPAELFAQIAANAQAQAISQAGATQARARGGA